MFKVRDLLIVAAVVLGVCGGVYRQEIVEASRKVAAPVWWYVDAPAREAMLLGEIDAERARSSQVLAAAQAQVSVVEAERDRLFGELAGLKTRHAGLCQVLLELGNDVPSVLAAE